MDYPHRIREMLLINSLASAGFEDEISCGFLVERVVAEEGDNARPLRDDRLPFITFPTLIDLPQSAKLTGNVLLTQAEDQPPIEEVLTEGHRAGD